MRVLIAHNRYQQAGGEDGVVINEARLLAEQGIDVVPFYVSNDIITNWAHKLSVLATVAYNARARDEFAQRIAAVRPDIVHVHNFFPLLTPAIYDACLAAGVPVVQTLHNYRTICAGALLLRDGVPCEQCVGHSPYWGMLYGCYRGSRAASAAVAYMIERHKRERTWHRKVTHFIALSDFARQRFIAGGLPADKIIVKPNVVFAHEPTALQPRRGALYVGRLSAEKGVLDLIEAWKTIDCPLTIAGDGPLGPQLRAASTPNITFLGNVSRERVYAEMRKAAFLIAPSICYENFPLAIAEAFACRLPAIVSGMGAMAEIVEDGRTGLHFKPHAPDDLADKVRFALRHEEKLPRMGEEAYRFYERHLSPSANIKSLLAIYVRALRHDATDQVAFGQSLHESHFGEHVA